MRATRWWKDHHCQKIPVHPWAEYQHSETHCSNTRIALLPSTEECITAEALLEMVVSKIGIVVLDIA